LSTTAPGKKTTPHSANGQAIQKQNEILKTDKPGSPSYQQAEALLNYYLARNQWIEIQTLKLRHQFMPPVRPYHWEEDVGGNPELNQYLPWWEQTRINSKDLSAALIFGIRISLTVGLVAVLIALMIGIPIGALAGYYAGTFDIIVSRLLELWESMPTFFMLLLVVAMTQSKSIFLVIAVIGFFGWTGFSRYIRGEFFKQRNLSYVEACKGLGFRDSYIIFSHILPNAIPPLLTLLPFAIMGAITSEAGLSFLGLGEEGSCSWGVLMDEGRSAFPAQSSLLWPPAILLTLLLVAIALVGDSLRDALDPKMQQA
jgi:peptide/nickel transport system permease protein